MDENTTRSLIFLVAGLILILWPKKVLKFQLFVLRKFHLKYDAKKEYKYNPHLGIIFIIIAIVLFVYSIIN